MKAKKKPVEALTAEGLGVGASPALTTLKARAAAACAALYAVARFVPPKWLSWDPLLAAAAHVCTHAARAPSTRLTSPPSARAVLW